MAACIGSRDYSANLRLFLLAGPLIFILFVAASVAARAATFAISSKIFRNRRLCGVIREILTELLTAAIWLALAIVSGTARSSRFVSAQL